VESKCTPDVNLLWRVLFILFCGLTTNAIVGSYFNQFFLPQMRINFQYLDLLLFTGQILFQFLIFRWFGLRDFLNYAGHIAFISMMGALIMGFIHIVLSIFSQYGLDIGILASAGFGVALGFMLMVHIKRIGMIGQTKWLTLTWVIYRMMIYPLVFNL
jgi:hypothetical protein